MAVTEVTEVTEVMVAVVAAAGAVVEALASEVLMNSIPTTVDYLMRATNIMTSTTGSSRRMESTLKSMITARTTSNGATTSLACSDIILALTGIMDVATMAVAVAVVAVTDAGKD